MIEQVKSDYNYYQKRAYIESTLTILTMIASMIFLTIGGSRSDVNLVIPGVLGFAVAFALAFSTTRSCCKLDILEQQLKNPPTAQKILHSKSENL